MSLWLISMHRNQEEPIKSSSESHDGLLNLSDLSIWVTCVSFCYLIIIKMFDDKLGLNSFSISTNQCQTLSLNSILVLWLAILSHIKIGSPSSPSHLWRILVTGTWGLYRLYKMRRAYADKGCCAGLFGEQWSDVPREAKELGEE